ncbi:MAG TPA: hypothetical protein VJ898_11705, partial [Natrialbaceae archaeon]|nr:hypothetical protein [Natrialbaceae archaeon]
RFRRELEAKPDSMAIPTISGYALERFGLGDPGTRGFDVAFWSFEKVRAHRTRAGSRIWIEWRWRSSNRRPTGELGAPSSRRLAPNRSKT